MRTLDGPIQARSVVSARVLILSAAFAVWCSARSVASKISVCFDATFTNANVNAARASVNAAPNHAVIGSAARYRFTRAKNRSVLKGRGRSRNGGLCICGNLHRHRSYYPGRRRASYEARWSIDLQRWQGFAHRLRSELGEYAPQSADARRERVSVALNDIV